MRYHCGCHVSRGSPGWGTRGWFDCFVTQSCFPSSYPICSLFWVETSIVNWIDIKMNELKLKLFKWRLLASTRCAWRAWNGALVALSSVIACVPVAIIVKAGAAEMSESETLGPPMTEMRHGSKQPLKRSTKFHDRHHQQAWSPSNQIN